MSGETLRLVEQLEHRIERAEARASKERAAGNVTAAAIAQAWADATRVCLDDVQRAAPWIEEDARFEQARKDMSWPQ